MPASMSGPLTASDGEPPDLRVSGSSADGASAAPGGIERRRGRPTAIAAHAHMVAALEAMPQPILVLGADADILHANDRANHLIRDGGILEVKDRRVVALGGDPGPWRHALHQVGKGVGCVLPFTAVGRRSARTGLIRLGPVRQCASYTAAWRHAVSVAVFELRSEADNRAALALLAARYGFTPTEVQVLQLLAAGHPLRYAAEQLNVKTSTARTHLRNLFDKTGLRRQTDLLRLLQR